MGFQHLFVKGRRALLLLRTRLYWSWRVGHLGRRTGLGRCRKVVNARSVWFGDHVTLEDGWFFVDLAPNAPRGPAKPKISIGHWCTILFDFQVNAAESVTIGDYVLIASRVLITDSDHVVDPRGPRTTRNPALNTAPVVVEHDCWLGQNAVILKGVRVGHHSVVAANAVVTRDVEPYSVVGGIPAKVIGSTRGDVSGGDVTGGDVTAGDVTVARGPAVDRA
jgi:acetyltransferase-like isoleucine patch superfamily enzyme